VEVDLHGPEIKLELELEVASIQMNEDDVVDGERSKFAYLNPL